MVSLVLSNAKRFEVQGIERGAKGAIADLGRDRARGMEHGVEFRISKLYGFDSDT
jgi:hypothetical protein